MVTNTILKRNEANVINNIGNYVKSMKLRRHKVLYVHKESQAKEALQRIMENRRNASSYQDVSSRTMESNSGQTSLQEAKQP